MSPESIGGLIGAGIVVAAFAVTFVLYRLYRTRRHRAMGIILAALVLALIVGGIQAYRAGYYDVIRATTALESDDFDGAIRWFERGYEKNPDAMMVAHDIACCYAQKGDEENCLIWLERALKSSYGDFAREHAKKEPDFDPLRGSPRFRELLYGEAASGR